MIVKLLTEHHLEFLSLKGGYRGSSESTLVKLLEILCPGSINSCHKANQYNYILFIFGDPFARSCFCDGGTQVIFLNA